MYQGYGVLRGLEDQLLDQALNSIKVALFDYSKFSHQILKY